MSFFIFLFLQSKKESFNIPVAIFSPYYEAVAPS